MNITVADLLNDPPTRSAAPTFAEYVPIVSAAISAGTRRADGSYWNKVVRVWGDRPIDEPRPTEIEQLHNQVQADVVARCNARGGRSATEHLIAALRCPYRRAVADGHLAGADNPALKVTKPRRLPSTRRAIADTRLAEINKAAATSGDDPALDCMLIRLHTETACRRGGALALRRQDLDPHQCLIYLREKGGTSRWQPVSPTLMQHLLAHHEERGDRRKDGPLLRYRDGRPLTYRRYDHLWFRIGQNLPWVHTQPISTHWLRHTTLTYVKRTFSHAIARAYAGHTDNNTNGSTDTYVRATLHEIPAAVASLTGEDHPLSTEL